MLDRIKRRQHMKQIKKTAFTLLIAIGMTLGMIPAMTPTASAVDVSGSEDLSPVSYIDENGTEQAITKTHSSARWMTRQTIRQVKLIWRA